MRQVAQGTGKPSNFPKETSYLSCRQRKTQMEQKNITEFEIKEAITFMMFFSKKKKKKLARGSSRDSARLSGLPLLPLAGAGHAARVRGGDDPGGHREQWPLAARGCLLQGRFCLEGWCGGLEAT